MEPIKGILDLFLHLDDHLRDIIRDYGTWTYLILFLIIFAETGLVVTPFLPGDSLLFAAGIFANPKYGPLNVFLLFAVLTTAAILGDTVNYWIGKYFGMRLFGNEKSRVFKKAHLDRTHAFYEKHGGKTIILARFVPIVRTFAPFVAGVGSMTYPKFLAYNVIGAVLWVGICLFGGYFFGGFRVVKDNFEMVIFAIIFLSVLPVLIEAILHRRSERRRRRAADSLTAVADEK